VFVVLTLVIAYFREPLIRMVRANQLPYELIESEKDLDDMLAEPNAFVFVKADWSIDSVIAQRVVDEFATDWSWFDREPSVKFYLLDATGPESKVILFPWSKSDEELGPIIHGHGYAIWLRDGKVLQVKHGTECTRDVLTEETKTLFQD